MNTLSLFELECKFQTLINENNLEPRKRGPLPKLSLAKMAVICVARAWFGVRSWKAFFSNQLIKQGWKALGGFELCSYSRFILRLRNVGKVLESWLSSQLLSWTGLGAVDSTLVALGRSWLREDRSKYKALRKAGASSGYGSTGPCFGVKLHLAIRDDGQVHAFQITPAKTHDLDFIKQGFLDQALGIILADSGYLSKQESERLQEKSIALWARPRKKSEQQFTPVQARLYRYREVVEGVFAKMKQSFGLVPNWPPRHMETVRAHVLGSLVAYVIDQNKPKMNWAFHNFGVK